MSGRRSNLRQFFLGLAFFCISLFYAIEMLGKPARIVSLITVILSALVSGMAFGRIRERRDNKKEATGVKPTAV